jgi:hypothetical protein
MSVLSVTTLTSADTITNLTLKTGNNSAGSIVINHDVNGISYNGPGHTFATGADDYVQLIGGGVDVCRSAGDAYIDFKKSHSEDFNNRIQLTENSLR